MIIDRRLQQHLISRYCQGAHDARYGGNDTCGKGKPLFTDLQMMPALPPADIRRIPFIRYHRIPVYTVRRPLPDRLLDLRGRPEVHISYSHGQFAGRDIPFFGIGSAPVYDLIKRIVYRHRFPPV